MWNTHEPPLNTRLLVSARGKVWIGRYRPRWPDFENCQWSFEGKTTAQTGDWEVDGWLPLPDAVNQRPNSYWRPTCYLDALEISVRSVNVLRKAGLTSEEQILSLTESDIRALPAAGEKTVREILEMRDKPYEKILARIS